MNQNNFEHLIPDQTPPKPTSKRRRKKQDKSSLAPGNGAASTGITRLGSTSLSSGQLSDDSSIALAPLRSESTLTRSVSFDQACVDATHAITSTGPTLLASSSDMVEILNLPDSPSAPDLPSLTTPTRQLIDISHPLTARPPLRSSGGKSDPNYASPVGALKSPSLAVLRGDLRTVSTLETGTPDSPMGLALTRREAAHWAPPPPPSALPRQPLGDYLTAELLPGPSYATTDVVWGQTERDRVYNSVVGVPFQLERLLMFGTALCLDSFLAMFTVLPIRVCLAIISLFRQQKPTSSNNNNNQHSVQSEPLSPASTSSRSEVFTGKKLRGDQLFDILCASMFSVAVAFLWNLRAGSIYFWVKDLTQEFLKISVLHTALELADKICCSFGVDILVALAASCTHAVGAGRGSWDAIVNLVTDALMATAFVVAHGAALMSQALVFSVAMNSRKNTLIALLIASNFTEIKGTVFKRFDPTRINILACQDIVERFHLGLVLLFVAVEEAAGAGRLTPSSAILWQCAYVFLAEIVIDIVKHAVLVKFNDIRPGVYREFMRDLCDKASGAQSHSVHRLVGFEPFAPCALFIRLASTFFVLIKDLDEDSPVANLRKRTGLLVAGYVGVWLLIVLLKVVLGYVLKMIAVSYVRAYDAGRTRTRGAAAAAAQLRGATTTTTHIGASGGKKDE